MWGNVDDKEDYLIKAIKFTGNAVLYGSFMNRVVNEWSISCENALTDFSINRKAWIGHAASALALNCPEDITRMAWGKLNEIQQILANREADRAIKRWEDNYRKNKNIREYLGETMLF